MARYLVSGLHFLWVNKKINEKIEEGSAATDQANKPPFISNDSILNGTISSIYLLGPLLSFLTTSKHSPVFFSESYCVWQPVMFLEKNKSTTFWFTTLSKRTKSVISTFTEDAQRIIQQLDRFFPQRDFFLLMTLSNIG